MFGKVKKTFTFEEMFSKVNRSVTFEEMFSKVNRSVTYEVPLGTSVEYFCALVIIMMQEKACP